MSVGTAPFSLVVGWTPPPLAMEFLGVLVLEEKELGLAKAWEAEDLVKG
jgi:hypothetical protein